MSKITCPNCGHERLERCNHQSRRLLGERICDTAGMHYTCLKCGFRFTRDHWKPSYRKLTNISWFRA